MIASVNGIEAAMSLRSRLVFGPLLISAEATANAIGQSYATYKAKICKLGHIPALCRRIVLSGAVLDTIAVNCAASLRAGLVARSAPRPLS